MSRTWRLGEKNDKVIVSQFKNLKCLSFRQISVFGFFFPPAEAAILFQDRLYFSHENGPEMNMDDRKGLNHFVIILTVLCF